MGKSIDDYRRKRDFANTPEPQPGDEPARARRPVFVVHRHDASRLHFDLRLEMEGVLRSWAIPKGFSYDPDDKHLAIRTEDHPLEYEVFEGVIPKGQYGAGTMTIWDHGTYEVVVAADGPSAVASGEVKVILRGRRLRGEWHLVKTKQGEDTWLLFKSRDRYVGPSRDAALGIDLAQAPRRPMPTTFSLMLMGRTESAPFSDPAWVFEMWFDGKRALAVKNGDTVTWSSRSWSLPHVEDDLQSLRAEAAVLDGVLVVCDENDRPSRRLLDEALARGDSSQMRFYAFDLLYFDEFDLRSLPTVDRKAGLRILVPPLEHVMYVDHVAAGGEQLAEVITAAGLPSMVAKRVDAPYEAGPSAAWAHIPIRQNERSAALSVSAAMRRVRNDPGPARVRLSNLQKVYWPGAGLTKGELLSYYTSVADVLLPYLRGRPLHLRRFPDGILGKSFYQKNVQDMPDWVATELVGSDTPYVVCNDLDTLLFLINLGSIDLHPWMSHQGSLDSPDYAVIDLDPKDAPFLHVIEIARRVGEVLRTVGLRPLLKTSGATGLHIHVPLQPGYTYDQARMFCEGVARLVARDLPAIATIERVVGQREGRVYIDYGQNRRGQTIVPPYVCRPVRGATVSAPLAWSELTDELSPAVFTILTMPARHADKGDLFAPLLEDGQDLLPAATALQDLLA